MRASVVFVVMHLGGFRAIWQRPAWPWATLGEPEIHQNRAGLGRWRTNHTASLPEAHLQGWA